MLKLYKHGEIRFNVEEKNTQTEDVGSWDPWRKADRKDKLKSPEGDLRFLWHFKLC